MKFTILTETKGFKSVFSKFRGFGELDTCEFNNEKFHIFDTIHAVWSEHYIKISAPKLLKLMCLCDEDLEEKDDLITMVFVEPPPLHQIC